MGTAEISTATQSENFLLSVLFRVREIKVSFAITASIDSNRNKRRYFLVVRVVRKRQDGTYACQAIPFVTLETYWSYVT